jgi:putative membrane protein
MRFAILLLVLVFAAFGALFGALNSASIDYDFYFFAPHLPKGAALLLALLLGWLIGGLLVYVSLVAPLRRRVRAQTRELKRLNHDRLQAEDAHPAAAAILTPPREA